MEGRILTEVDNVPGKISDSDLIEIWKKTIEVQQHFNDIGLKIRTAAVTVLSAFIAAIGFSIKENLIVTIFDSQMALSVVLSLGAMVVWWAFYFMDKNWYHRFLLGAVEYGEFLEKGNPALFGESGLTGVIRKKSPNKFCSIELHSNHKFYIFYGVPVVLLIIVAYGIYSSS